MSDPKNWRIETDDDGIVWLGIDNADDSANVLSAAVLEELVAIIAPYEVNPPRGLVIYSGKNNGFIMGADIKEFTRIESAEQAYDLVRLGQQVMDRV